MSITSHITGYTHVINSAINCKTENLIYAYKCKKCPISFSINTSKRTPKKPVKKGVKATYYFGKSKRKFNRRLYEHLYYVTSRKMDEPSAQHFCQAGHSAHDLVALGLEHVRSRDPFILRAREHLLIKKFDSYRNGLNQEPWTWLATLASIFLLVSHSIYVLLDEYDCSIWFIKHACDHGNLNFPKILKLCKVLSWIWWESFVGHFTK